MDEHRLFKLYLGVLHTVFIYLFLNKAFTVFYDITI
jgi:hypothetical protein